MGHFPFSMAMLNNQRVMNSHVFFPNMFLVEDIPWPRGYDYELAITSSDAMRLASCAQPPYGLLLGMEMSAKPEWAGGGWGLELNFLEKNLGQVWENDNDRSTSEIDGHGVRERIFLAVRWIWGFFAKKPLGLKARMIRDWKHAPWGMEKRAVEAVEISANIMGLNNLTNLLEIYIAGGSRLTSIYRGVTHK